MLVRLHQTVAIAGGFEFLIALESHPATALSENDIRGLMIQAGVEDPEFTLAEFLAAGLLTQYGDRLGLTTFGIRTTLLLEALNGGDLRDVYRRLGRYDTNLQMYELVREGMTTRFLESINHRPGFSRLYLCSPWISLDARQRDMLIHAVVREESRGERPEIYVICRPTEGGNGGGVDRLAPLRELGATILFNSRLHTKLYIREPTRSGGYSMAIVGSENLTGAHYLELGIRINADSAMISQLIRYFLDLANASQEA
jgi:hypothetical protein